MIDLHEVKRAVDIEINKDWLASIQQTFRYLLHCRATINNVRGVSLSVYSAKPRKVGDTVNIYGEEWTVEECENL